MWRWLVLVVLGGGLVVGLASLQGTGAWKRYFTLGGYYSVADIDGYSVVCFGEKGVPGISCLPKSEVLK